MATLAYCENLSWGGYTDWYLPNKNEIGSIIDDSGYNPSIDTFAFPATPASYFWSSSSYANVTSNAWVVYFYYGFVNVNGKANGYYGRCVRRGP